MKKQFLFLFVFCISFIGCFSQQRQYDAFKGTATGTDTYTVTISAITDAAPYDGQKIEVLFSNTNTGAATLRVLGAGTITYTARAITLNGSALSAGDIVTNQYLTFKYYLSGTSWQLEKAGLSTGTTGTYLVQGANTYTNNTSINATGSLLFKGTVNAGARYTSRSLIDKGYADSLKATITSSQWTTTGSDIYYTTGKVGIGTATPTGRLDARQADILPFVRTGTLTPTFRMGSDVEFGSFEGIDFGQYGNYGWMQGWSFSGIVGLYDPLAILINPKGGFVGIGTNTTAPTYLLHVKGSNATLGIETATAGTGIAKLKIKNLKASWDFLNDATNGKLSIFDFNNGNTAFVIDTLGRVGVGGNTSPAYALDVTGGIKSSTAIYTTDIADGDGNPFATCTQASKAIFDDADATVIDISNHALLDNWTATTQTAGDNSTKIATTAYVDRLVTEHTATLSLTAAQIKTLNSVPIDIVATPGAGYINIPTGGYIVYTYSTAAFTSNNFQFYHETATGYMATSTGMNLQITNSQSTLIIPLSAGTNALNVIANKKIQVKADSDSAVGGGSAKIFITYITVPSI